jgi:CHAP domain
LRRVDSFVVDALDEAGAEWFAFQHAVDQKDWRTLMANAASAFLNIKEDKNNSGLWVELVQKTVDGRAMREPYCVAFCMTILGYVEMKIGRDSPLVPTESVMYLWNNTPEHLKTKAPRPGYIACWNHRGTSRGHAGIVREVYADGFTCIEGNTPPSDKEFSKGSFEGEGIYLKTRPFKSVGTMDLLGFLIPFEE